MLGLFVGLLGGVALQAEQQPDNMAEQGEAVLKKLTIPEAPVLKPEDALKSFKVAPGFSIELVASEPLVSDPVALSFDPDGRIYVCEMRGYMPDIDGKGEKDPVGRIVVLEDADGDGRMDKGTIFLDQLVMPRAVCWTPQGVLVAENAKLWQCRDTNGDGKCDEKTALFDYGGGGNPEYGANGLLPALDNWIYSACAAQRLRRIDGQWSRDTTISRGQWGIAQDDLGRLYSNSNSSLLRGDRAACYSPLAHVANPFANVQLYQEQDVWPARVTPGVNRGYYNLRPDGTLKSVTAACGPCIFRGDNLPAEVHGNAFICEPAANLVRRNVFLSNKGSPTSKNAYTKAEFLASTDERFRPVNCYNAPDGSLYIVDLYRGILQHKAFLTPFLRKQIIDRGLDKPIGLGRIYRVVHESSKARKPAPLGKLAAADLVPVLADANGWRRDMAQRLLVDKADAATVPALEKMLTEHANPLARLHAFWTLEGMNKLEIDPVLTALADKDAAVRGSAVAGCRRFLKTPPNPDVLNELAALAKDASLDVRLQLVFTLGLIPSPKVDEALEPTLHAAADDNQLLEVLLAGFAGRETEFLAARLDQPRWAKAEPWREKLLAAAARYVWRQRQPVAVLRFLHVVGAQGDAGAWRQTALLQGATASPPKAAPNKAAPKPIKLPTPAPALEKLLQSPNERLKTLAQTMAKDLLWPGKDGQPLPEPPPLPMKFAALYELGRKEYVNQCANCHHPAGYGEAGKAPPLLDSDWLSGSPERLVRMVLHGMRGPMTINREVFNRDGALDMPALGMALDDEKIASVLTYARWEWGDYAAGIEPAAVTRIRTSTKDRMDQWTEKELLKIK